LCFSIRGLIAVGMAWWQPHSFQPRLPLLKLRQQVISATRAYFDSCGFHEVETPALQTSPGLEPHIMAFHTVLENHDGSPRQKMYLHTSPEFAMKKLLVAGAGNIYQICNTFRNRENSPTHSPEFSMIEWYRTGANYWAIMDDCVQLLRGVATACKIQLYRYKGKISNPFSVWQVISVADAFRQYCKINLLDTVGDAAALRAEATRIGVRTDDGDNWDDIFFRIMGERIEPYLGTPAPTLLYDYPAHMAALSKIKESDPRVAERVEVYVCGLELANGFSELTNAAQQRARFEADMDYKEQTYGFRYPIDEDFIAALETGLPECSGIALGMDRLVMLATGAENINDILWAPVA